jgi:superfamily II DNA or RNA helicase|tara:strand:+ start:2491 stop:3981 length:1491 start_codon:yes stop_codon:yes gene_type:complete
MEEIHSRLSIEKVDEVYIKVRCEPHIAAELSEFFTFEVPGARFSPAYRNRVWDGKIRLYNKKTGKVYGGLLAYIHKFAEQNELEVVQGKDVYSSTKIDMKDVEGFCKSLKPQSQGKDIEIRDYQIQAIYQCLKRHKLLLLSPTASGKSLIIYSIVRFHQMANRKTLIIVPTTSLVEQMYSDFADYGWEVDKYCHRIYHGYDKDVVKDVVISTWQSLATLDKDYFQQFDCVIGDEAHNFKAKSLTTIMTALNNAKYRIGTTGTLDGTKTHKLVLEGLFGTVYRATSTKKLIDKNQLSKLTIKCLVLKHNEKDRRQIKGATYLEEMEHIVGKRVRNNFIRNLALSTCTGNTLILFQYVEKHGKPLYDEIVEKANDGRKVFFVYGGTETNDRERIRAITEKLDNTIIVASYGTFSTGINIRNLHNIIFSSPSKSPIRILQSIGRGLRLGDQKQSATVYDIADDLSIGSYKNFTLDHFAKRVEIYNEEQFNYEIHNVELK